MIQNCLLMRNGIVENAIVADPEVDPAPEGYELIGEFPDFVWIGSERDENGEWIKPPSGAPEIPGVETL